MQTHDFASLPVALLRVVSASIIAAVVEYSVVIILPVVSGGEREYWHKNARECFSQSTELRKMLLEPK